MSYMALSRASRSSAVPQIPKNRPGVPAFLQKLFECVLSRHYMETAYLDHRMLSDIHSQDLIRWADTADSFFGLFSLFSLLLH